MKLLADAHISPAMTRWLVSEGHDVLHASTLPPATSDLELLRRAGDEARVVLTADSDFGELVFLHRVQAAGVILLRVRTRRESDRVARFAAAWPTIITHLPGSFLTLTASDLRIRPMPG